MFAINMAAETVLAKSAVAAGGAAASAAVSTVPGWVQLCGKMAPITGVITFLAPIPTIRQVSKTRSVGSLPLLPYSSMIANAFVWVMYGLLQSEFKVWSCNAVGIILGAYYFNEFRRSCPRGASGLPGTVSQHILGTSSLLTFNLALAAFLQRSNAAGIIGKEGVMFCILMFASPLAALKTVFETKSATSIPLPFTIATIANCVLWTVTGTLDMNDFNIYFPNALGLTFGLIQLLLKFVFGNGPKTSSVDKIGRGGGSGGIQLPM